ncbi:hypothetical protein AHAS_Ahas13G0289000 [Arachis hypogaea]
MVVQSYVEEGVHRYMMGLAGNYKGSTISIVSVRTLEWFLHMLSWWRLLPRGLSISLRLLPPLIVPTLMHVFIVGFIPYNIIGTKLIAKGVRIHNNK